MKFKPSGWAFIRKYENTLEKLRSTGRKLFEQRLKSLEEEDSHIQEDLFSTFFQHHRSFYFSFNRFFKAKTYYYMINSSFDKRII